MLSSTVSPDVLCQIKLQEALSATEAYREEIKARFEKESEPWSIYTRKRYRRRDQVNKQIATVNVAIEAMQAALERA